MQKTKILQCDHRVHSYEVDRHQKLSIRALMSLFQELANQHADLLGFGYKDLNTIKQAWVLSRMRIEIKRRPIWNEEISLKTWTAGMIGLFGTRYFNFSDRNEQLIAASSDWLVIDIEKRKPIRKSNDDFQDFLHSEKSTTKPPGKLPQLKSPELLATKKVEILDIDMNGHVNNIHYLAWVLDAILTSVDDSFFPKYMDLNFIKEITWPATLNISKCSETKHLYSIDDAETSTSYFKVQFD